MTEPRPSGSQPPPMLARLGLVSYLNSKPIGYGLLSGRQRGRFEIVQSVPSDLADDLERGALDLALLPSVEYARARARGHEPAIVPGIAIASRGAAESVLLFMRVPPGEVRRIAVDRSSRTSVALLRLLLRRGPWARGSEPELVTSPPNLPGMLSACEAALVIGDRALLAAREHPALVRTLETVDLGSQWTAMTGLPFVFAFWAGPKRTDSPEIVAALQDSLAEGLDAIAGIARESSGGDVGLETVLRRYLTYSIGYRLGRDEIRGLETFYALLVEEGILEGPAPRLSFHATAACARDPR